MNFARESIIVSAIRSFCTSFAGIVGVLIGLILIFICVAMFSAPDIYPPQSKLLIEPDANGSRTLLHQTAPVILKLNIRGEIGLKDLTYDNFNSLLLDSREGMLAHDRVKAILLHINTPGGAADDSDWIYEALMAYKKKFQVPVYAYVEGMCASGGMYVASSADKIYSAPSSIIGSVGVLLGPVFNFSGLMQQYGVQSLSLTQGKDKDMLNPYRAWQPGEDASLRAITASLYERFVNVVATARPNLDRTKLVNEYGAQVYIAKQAMEYGYIDNADATYGAVLTDLAAAANIAADTHYQVFSMQTAPSFLQDLVQNKFGLLSGKITHSFPGATHFNPELNGRFLYLYQPQ